MKNLPLILILAIALMVLAPVSPHSVQLAQAAGFTVENTSDAGPKSLPQAIVDANGTTGATISFAIPASDAGCTVSVCRINPVTELPKIIAPVTIDGWSQGGPGYVGPPL
ncbi:MAG: hypothetical protein HY329_17575, partial [Chloroflexi bacterium]|nr:hypothetical protein [Chloroflexota bacterium]